MARTVALAVIRDEPPEVFVAENQEVLNWVIALKLIARTSGRDLAPDFREKLRAAILDERWGDAVQLWIASRTPVDVYSSHQLFTQRDVELAAEELEFSPLFED